MALPLPKLPLPSKEYSGDQVIFSFANISPTGLGDDDFLEIDPVTENYKSSVSNDKQVTWSRQNDPRVMVTLTLMYTSDSNDLLSALETADRYLPNGAGVAPLQITDRNGRTLLLSGEARIVKRPKVTFGRQVSKLQWVFECAELEGLIGGT